MTGIAFYVIALFLTGLIVYELISGNANARIARVSREDNPGVYWVIVALQLAFILLFLLTGRSWHGR